MIKSSFVFQGMVVGKKRSNRLSMATVAIAYGEVFMIGPDHHIGLTFKICQHMAFLVTGRPNHYLTVEYRLVIQIF